MRYLKVVWRHTSPDDPVLIWSEIGEDGYETRKVEQFADGRLGYADASTSVGGSELGEFPVPPLSAIARQKEFTPEAITAKAFEKKWSAALNPAIKRTKSTQRAKVRLHQSKGGVSRSLAITKTHRGWSVVTARTRRTIATLKTRDAAVQWAKKALQSTRSVTSSITVTSDKTNSSRESKK